MNHLLGGIFIMTLACVLVSDWVMYQWRPVRKWLVTLSRLLISEVAWILSVMLSKQSISSFTVKEKVMANREDIKMYRFSRGEKYSCQVTIINDSNVIFSKVVVPPKTPPEVQARLLEDAEKQAIKLHNAKS
jgi:hypothetical protein